MSDFRGHRNQPSIRVLTDQSTVRMQTGKGGWKSGERVCFGGPQLRPKQVQDRNADRPLGLKAKLYFYDGASGNHRGPRPMRASLYNIVSPPRPTPHTPEIVFGGDIQSIGTDHGSPHTIPL